MSIASAIKSNPRLKQLVHKALVNSQRAQPRFWVRWFVSPFIHHKGRGAIVKWSARMDIFPFNKFSLGSHATIEDFCTINNGVGDVIIGEETRIGIGNVIIGPVTIGSQVILAQHIAVSGMNHTYTDVTLPTRKQKVTTAPIVIEDEVWVGANAVITAGVTIGKHSVVAAGAVVTKNIPPYSIAVGNPARVIKKYDFDKAEWVRV